MPHALDQRLAARARRGQRAAFDVGDHHHVGAALEHVLREVPHLRLVALEQVRAEVDLLGHALQHAVELRAPQRDLPVQRHRADGELAIEHLQPARARTHRDHAISDHSAHQRRAASREQDLGAQPHRYFFSNWKLAFAVAPAAILTVVVAVPSSGE